MYEDNVLDGGVREHNVLDGGAREHNVGPIGWWCPDPKTLLNLTLTLTST